MNIDEHLRGVLKCREALLRNSVQRTYDLISYVHDKNNMRRELGETLRVWARAQGASNRTEITDELLKQMEYT
ncbi:hypothetical protein VSF3289_03633 [Vibrio scophthalmi]|uniref:Uncharacterized protein n=1 Tax=Vibrio scophthalmi TaxID=45658 RepID=A0A1E3WFB7_9VIBR|nr:hypothetical protein VSF3289_03633 [Vibrio scophthalmi]